MSIMNPNTYIVAVFDEPAPTVQQLVKALGTTCMNFNVGRITPVKK